MATVACLRGICDVATGRGKACLAPATDGGFKRTAQMPRLRAEYRTTDLQVHCEGGAPRTGNSSVASSQWPLIGCAIPRQADYVALIQVGGRRSWYVLGGCVVVVVSLGLATGSCCCVCVAGTRCSGAGVSLSHPTTRHPAQRSADSRIILPRISDMAVPIFKPSQIAKRSFYRV